MQTFVNASAADVALTVAAVFADADDVAAAFADADDVAAAVVVAAANVEFAVAVEKNHLKSCVLHRFVTIFF